MDEMDDGKKPIILYHYTTVESMFSILSSMKLRLYNTHQMNDPTDTRWIIHLVEDELSARNIKDSEIINFFREELWAISGAPLFSFSLSGNPDLLGQWVHYAAGGRGVAMGFNMEECSLQESIPQMVRGPDDPSFSILKMNYDTAWQRDIIRTIVDALEKYSSLDEYRSNLPAHKIRNLGMLVKHPGFKEEEEWRILNSPALVSEIGDYGLHYHVNHHILREYRETEIKRWFRKPFLREVVLGPTCPLRSDILHRFAYTQCDRLELVIRRSAIPYAVQ